MSGSNHFFETQSRPKKDVYKLVYIDFSYVPLDFLYTHIKKGVLLLDIYLEVGVLT